MIRSHILTFALSLCPVLAAAEAVHFRGELQQDGGVGVDLYHGYSVKLRAAGGGLRAYDSPVQSDGSFDVRDMPTGTYELTVLDERGNAVRTDLVVVETHTGPLKLRIAGRVKEGKAGAVSVVALTRVIPGKAKKEFARAHKALSQGKEAAGIEHFQRALEIAPDYVEAHNDLGVRHYSRGEFDLALRHWSRAAELEPSSHRVLTNLAAVLMVFERYPEAEQYARKARTLSGSENSSLILGIALLNQNRETAFGLNLLEGVSAHYPRAHLVLSAWHNGHGQPELAKQHATAYQKAEQTRALQGSATMVRRAPEGANKSLVP